MTGGPLLPGVVLGAVVAAGTMALTTATDGWRALTAEEARRLAVQEDPRRVPRLTLTDGRGNALDLGELRGRHVLVDFIYTGCAHACTTLGVTFRQIQEALPDKRLGEDVVLLSITFDRARDDPERLRNYAERFDAHPGAWRVARPRSDDDLERLLRRFGVVVIPDGGEFVHNAAIYLVDPDGQLTRIFEFDRPDAVIEHMERIL